MEDHDLLQLKTKIANSMRKILAEESAPPEGEKPISYSVHIPHSKILPTGEPNTATASVTYVTVCPTEKKHTVNVKFKYDKAGKFIRSSMTYV
jgi:hypothetical protein